MEIRLIAVGTRMPGWVEQGYNEYAKRMPPECRLQLTEIPAAKRGKNSDIPRLNRDEGQRMLAAIPKNSRTVALEVMGKPWSTEKLAKKLSGWLQEGDDIALLVGGPDGLSDECRRAAVEQWSLSPLTLPHPLVRIVLAEQIYRAWTVLKNHPYHRG